MDGKGVFKQKPMHPAGEVPELGMANPEAPVQKQQQEE